MTQHLPSPYWHFRFRYQGAAFRASTKTTGRDEAGLAPPAAGASR